MESLPVIFDKVKEHIWRDFCNSSWHILSISFTFLGLCLSTDLFNSAHMFSIGLRSGDWYGHCSSHNVNDVWHFLLCLVGRKGFLFATLPMRLWLWRWRLMVFFETWWYLETWNLELYFSRVFYLTCPWFCLYTSMYVALDKSVCQITIM